MRETDVLVIGTNDSDDLLEALLERGCTAAVSDHIEGAVRKLRHGEFGLVFIDRDHIEADLVELVLNVRDVDASVPILVIGCVADREVDEQLRQHEATHFMTRPQRSTQLNRRLGAALRVAAQSRRSG